jgi:hypothetical protein
MTALARRHGGSAPARLRKRAPRAPRSLLRVARENAVEGCVRETYGALLATYQALEARAPHVRRTLARIARDETAHAALAWKIHAWASTRLTLGELRAIERARARAFDALLRELEQRPAAALVADAGMPRPEQARKLLEGIAALAA